MRVVFTGGGTGGHVYPNIAIYEAIKDQYPDSAFLYIGTTKGAENRITRNISQPIPFKGVLSKGLPNNIKSFKTIIALLYIFLGTLQSYFLLKKFKPDIIIGSGGYVAAPVLFAASFLKLKVFIHEQNAVPGRLNRFIARFANRIGVSFSSTSQYFPENKVVVCGYPLRKSIRYNKNQNIKEKYNIPEKNKVVFVFGGSGGSRTINNATAEVIPTLLSIDDLTIILSTGRSYSTEYKAFDDTVKIFETIGIPSDVEGKLIIREYFDNIDEIYSIADLVVSRAGAGTIKEITTLGLPSILIPKIDLPGDHQILNAREVEKIGGAKIVYESVTYKGNRQTIYVPETALLETIRSLISDEDALFNMRKNLHQLEKQNSTEVILKELDQLVKGKEKQTQTQIKIFYLQSQDTEKSIEFVFDSTTVGNSVLCDVFLEGIDDPVIVEFKILKNQENIIVRRRKGHVNVTLDGKPVENWTEIKENAVLEIGNLGYVMKSYFENVEKVRLEKSTASNLMGSSLGIMFSRVGGFFREMVIAAYFGASKATDIFATGLTIAYFFRRVVAENALENAFLPVFSRLFYRTSRKKTWEASSSIINFTILFSLVATILLVIFTPFLITRLFPQFAIKGMVRESIVMTQLILPYLFLVTLSAVQTTYLKAFNRFGVAEGSAIFFSIGTILGVFLFKPYVGLYSLAYGVLLSGIMQVLFLVPFVSRVLKTPSIQFSYKPVIHFSSPINKKYYSQLLPITVDVILTRTAEMVSRILASGLKVGAISYLYFSQNIFQLPFAIVSQAISGVVLKEFSEHISLFDKKKARQLFMDGIKINLFLLTPLSVLMIVLAQPIVAVLLGRGHFNPAMVADTAQAFRFFSIGLIGWGLHALTVRIFSARFDLKTSLFLNLLMLVVNISLGLTLVKTSLTFSGLALSTSISFLLFSAIRIIVLKTKLKRDDIIINYRDILVSFTKTLFATVIMVIVLIHAGFIFQGIKFKSPFVNNLLQLVSLTFIGISVYFLTSLMLKNTELLIFKKRGRRKEAEVPLSMLSPQRFLERVSKNSDAYRDDYLYKINIYLFSNQWSVRNVGVKLIGIFGDESKIDFLVNLLKAKKDNGFTRRNAVYSLKVFGIWNPGIKQLMKELLKDPYYEVRTAAVEYLAKCAPIKDFNDFRNEIRDMATSKRSSLEERIACLHLMAKLGDMEDLELLGEFFLDSNSLIREEILELLYSYYRRKLLSDEELKQYIGKVLITSNNLNPEFKLKSIIKKIYKEIE